MNELDSDIREILSPLFARAEKAEAERDEALAKLKEQREWADNYREAMQAEHENAKQALAQMAVLVDWLRENVPGILNGNPTHLQWGLDDWRYMAKRLHERCVNLPDAAKEMVEDRDRLREALTGAYEILVKFGLELNPDEWPDGDVILKDIRDALSPAESD